MNQNSPLKKNDGAPQVMPLGHGTNPSISLVSSQPLTATHHKLATANQRTIAFLLDAFIAASLSALVMAFLSRLTQATVAATDPGMAPRILRISIFISYWVFPLYAAGQTLGKKLIGIKVLSDKRHGDSLGFFQALGRETIGRLISGLPLCLGYLGASRRQDRKTFHDRIYSTKVISLK